MTNQARPISLNEIFAPNSQYIQDLAQQFELEYGEELDIILRLSDKYDCAFADIDPAALDPEDVSDYAKVQAR